MKIGLIDDEKNVREGLKELLRLIKFDHEILIEADSVEDGLQKLSNLDVDILLLDISMKDGTGFDLLKALGKFEFQLIFVTAYDQYAIKAFKYNALDYILKPVDPNELLSALERAKSRVLSEADHEGNAKPGHEKLFVSTQQEQYILSIREIVYCQADGSYTRIVTNARTILASKNLSHFQQLLPTNLFIRSHQSYLVNIMEVDFLKNNILILKNQKKIPVSARRKTFVLQFLKKN